MIRKTILNLLLLLPLLSVGQISVKSFKKLPTESPLYHTEAGKIEMGTDKKMLAVALKPAFGYLNITTQPESGALVTIDGERVDGVSPVKSGRLKSGEHTVELTKTGCAAESRQITITEGETTELNVTLKEATAIGQQSASSATFSCGESFTDPRDGQKYATKLMKDGRCWMVENLRFGKCDAAAFKKYSKKTAKDMIAPDYYGVCIASTESGGGNLYNWQAAMNHADAVFKTDGNPSGNVDDNSPAQWQGICPAGWHLPSSVRTGEFKKLYTALRNRKSKIYPGTGADGWRGVLGGFGNGTSVFFAGRGGYYWSSTYFNTNNAYILYFRSGKVLPQDINGKYHGFAVRCLKNY